MKPIRYTLDKTQKICGFSSKYAVEGECVDVVIRGFFYSDQKEFHIYVNQISNLFIGDRYLPDSIHRFLILIHKDSSADLYINDFPSEISILPKRDIKPGELIRSNDIADIDSLVFRGIKIETDDNIIFCFKAGWRFGLFFDFTRYDEDNVLNLDNLYSELGTYYKYLAFQNHYDILEDEPLFKQMVSDGWFPFIQILGHDFDELSNIYRHLFSKDEQKFNEFVNKFVDKFDRNTLDSFVEKWWKNDIFLNKKPAQSKNRVISGC
jgi:hypothetical protein